jgi:hypothetical protein
MSTLPRRESATQQAPIIDLHTRQPVTTAASKRGGKRDPLPRITITIPNYGKYQQQARRRDWVSVHKGIGRDSRMVQACERGLTPLAVFTVLLTLADNDGQIANVRAKDLSLEMCGVDQRTIVAALDALALVGIISKQEANVEQTLSKQPANAEQTVSVQSLHEEPSNDAALSATTVQDKDKTRQDITLADQGKPDPGSDVVSVIVSKDGQPFAITTAMVEAWQPHYPNADVAAEVGRIAVWHAANPSKQKTLRGMTAFVVNWLARSNNPTQLTIGGLTNGTNGRTQGNGKSLGQNMGVHRGTQPGGIYDIQM